MHTLYVPVTPDPSSVEGALAGMARVWERGGFDRVVLLVSPLARRGDVDRARWWAERLAGAGAVEEAEAPAPGDPGAVGRLEQLLSDCRGGAVLVSAASRWLSAALALAAPRDTCSIVYVSFYFGPWTGLVYPYTPWRLEPLHVLAGPRLRGGKGDGAAAAHAPPAWGAEELLGGGLPPLRAAVAEAARRLNKAYAGGCRRLRVRLDAAGIDKVIDLGDPEVLAVAAEELAKGVAGLKLPGDRGSLRSLAAFTGLAELHGLEKAGSVGRVYVDTSLIYYGVHVYRWEGLGVAVPECAVAEAEKRLAEAVKSGRIGNSGEAMAVAAWLGLHDLLGSGAPVLPTPPGPCDTAMAKADPLLLDGAALATADDGAYRYWSSHPVSRLATPLKASFNAYRQRWRGSLDTARVARLYYAIHQALLLLQLLAQQGVLPGFSLECLQGEGPGLEEVAGWLATRLGLAGGGS